MPVRATLTRRSLLQGSAAALAAPAFLRAAAAQAVQMHNPLVMPALETGQAAEGQRVFELTARPGETEFFAGHRTRTIGLNQSYLGPILSIRSGQDLRMNVRNGLAEEMTLHWHGLQLPARADGGPHQTIAPGGLWSPEFTMRERAGTYWYHGHAMHRTAAHVWAGMAGVIRVDDAESDALDLPASHGVDDFTLVLQDRRFTADFQMPYAPTMHDNMAGMAGDTIVVNGVVDPYLEIPAGRIRLRLLNGSNGSFYTLRFSDGRAFHQIASDGGLLAAPVTLTEALLAPGERMELVADFDDGAIAALLADVFSAEVQMMGPRGTATMVELRPTGPSRPAGAMPDRLADLPAAEASAAQNERRFELQMGGMGRMGGFTINGKAMDPARIDETVPAGAVETWIISNPTPMFHPFHIHNTQFRILRRNGAAPSPREAGFKDTVVLAPNDEVAVLCAFPEFSDAERPYMYHCHILEHEDAGMMGQFTVV